MHSPGLSPLTTQVADRISSIAPLEVTPVNAVVPRPALTLASIKASVDAVESAERRAQAVLDAATGALGKDGATGFTRFADSLLGSAAAAALGVAAAAAVVHLVGPESADYYNTYYHGWIHRSTNSWYYGDLAKTYGLAAVAGVSATIVPRWVMTAIATRKKTRMAHTLLDGRKMDGFVELLNAARERPLERAAIAKVARGALESLEQREIYCSPEVKALLSRSVEDEALGDTHAREQFAHYRAVVEAVRAIETAKGDLEEPIGGLEKALAALPPDERGPVAKDIYDRLFDNYVPRFTHIKYAAAQKLSAMLA